MVAFKGWKTLAFGLLITVLPVVLTFLGNIDWNNSGLPAWGISLIGIVIMALRYVTTTSIGKAAPAILIFGFVGPILASCVSPGVASKVDAVVVSLTTAETAYVSTCRSVPTLSICVDPQKTSIKALDMKAYNAVKAAEADETLLSLAISAVSDFTTATQSK